MTNIKLRKINYDGGVLAIDRVSVTKLNLIERKENESEGNKMCEDLPYECVQDK